jgi:peptide/nickel transport system substrate-binding protein
VPAGWFSAQGSTLPGWTDATGTGAYSGDHPVPAPTAGQIAAIDAAQTTASGWDQVTKLLPTNAWGNVQYSMVGSGPYYLSGYTIGTSYTLEANPAYAPNPACTTTYVGGTNDCYPPAGSYVSKIDVTWEVDPTPGEAAMASGVADVLGEFPVTQTSLLLQFIQQDKANLVLFPGISIYFFPFDLDFSATAAATYPTGAITIPGNFFSYIGMRNFFSTAYPYATSAATIITVDGIQYGINYGGIIPQGMGNYYPTNISFPSADPTSDVNDPSSPAYWWAQMTTPSSIYYDPEAVACETTTCQMPFFGETGSPNYDQALALEVQSVNLYSHGAIVVHTLDINFIQLVINSLFSAPGQNPMPIFTLAWAPDYPDPTDYIGAMYYPNATYTYSDDYNEITSNAATNSTSCEYDSIGAYSFAALQYWAAASTQIGNTCQAPAYAAMTFAEYQAAGDTDLAQRALLYNMAEHVAEKLALYIYYYQSIERDVVAPWINGASINEQVTIGGGNDQLWFFITGNGAVPS